MRDYQILLWDLDETLLDFKKTERYALTKSFESYKLNISDDIISLYSKINESYWKRLELGEITKAELLPGRFRTLFETLRIDKINPEEFRLEYQKNLGSVGYWIPEAKETVLACKDMGKKQYIITNGVAVTQRSRMHLSGLDKIMDGVFISEEVGVNKPNPLFFDKVFEELAITDRSCSLIIGDSLSSDMKGGVLSGVRTCWYNPRRKKREESIPVTHEISHITDILAFLS